MAPAASFSLLVKMRAYLPLCAVYQEVNCGSAAAGKHNAASRGIRQGDGAGMDPMGAGAIVSNTLFCLA